MHFSLRQISGMLYFEAVALILSLLLISHFVDIPEEGAVIIFLFLLGFMWLFLSVGAIEKWKESGS